MSIHWPCYCTVHVYVVIHYFNDVLSFWFEMNLSRFILIVYICMVCFVDICWIVDHHFLNFLFVIRGSCDRDHMVVGFTTCAISAYRHQSGEFESHSWRDVIMFVSDLWQVSAFLRFPPPIKLTTTIKLKYQWR